MADCEVADVQADALTADPVGATPPEDNLERFAASMDEFRQVNRCPVSGYECECAPICRVQQQRGHGHCILKD